MILTDMPEVVAIYMTGEPAKGVGPQDVALAIIGAVFGLMVMLRIKLWSSLDLVFHHLVLISESVLML